ncbi:MAG: hypothetical protein WCI45_12740, partial [Desulfuromonadales bacterium]
KLFHIFEDEINNKFEIVKSKIRYELNLIKEKIYGRNCQIKDITTVDEKIFFNLQENATLFSG